MCDSKYCRICLVYNVRMHKLSGSEVQEVYEKLSHKKFQEEVLDNACYSCYSQLLKCKQLVTTLQKSKELLKQNLINNELNLNSIPFQDRYTHGLVHSLTVTNIESLQIPEYIKITKTENQDESDTNEEMIKDETYDDSALKIEMSDLDEKYNFEQDETIWIPIEKQECVYGFKTNTKANENMLSHTVCEEKSKPVSGVRKSRTEYMRQYRQKKREEKLKTRKLEPKKIARNSTQRSRDFRARAARAILSQTSSADPTAVLPNLVVSHATLRLPSLSISLTPSTSTATACNTGPAEIHPCPAVSNKNE